MAFFVSVILIVVPHLAFVAAFLVMASLSKIFGMAKKQKPLYKLFPVAAALVLVSVALGLAGLQTGYPAYVYAAAGLDLAAMLLACGAAYFYWEWLPGELAGEVAHGENTGG